MPVTGMREIHASDAGYRHARHYLKTNHINSYNVVNITLMHRYSYFTSRYEVNVMEQRGGALWRMDV